MAVNGTLDKIVWGGDLCVTETWSCSVHLLHPGPADNVANLAGIRAAVTDWFQNSSMPPNSGATLNYVKINAVSPVTGRYLDAGNSNTLEFPNPGPSSNAAPAAPQLSVVVSLVTANSRGLGSKGRFYSPMPGTVDSTGHMSAFTLNNFLPVNVALLNAFNALIPGGRVVVFSPRGQITQDVTGVRIGDVVDTQRRRRKSLIEKYYAASL